MRLFSPKNWGISRDGRDVLQVYDLDSVMVIVPGVMCAEEQDCGCEFTSMPACVEGRCMREGMLLFFTVPHSCLMPQGSPDLELRYKQ